MPALRELQRAFGAALLSNDEAVCAWIAADGFSAAERLRIYRNTCHSTLTESLRMTYPAVERLVGREFFDAAAGEFIRAHPPASAHLNEYGDAFAGFLATFRPAGELRYLPDVARFEWALSGAANAPDAPALDAAALSGVDARLHAELRFEPHPSVRFLSLAYPADHICDAVLSADDSAMAEIGLASGPVRLVVHRGPDGVEARRLDPVSYDFVSRLCAGEPLGALLETAPPQAAPLLAEHLTRGRLTAFRLAS